MRRCNADERFVSELICHRNNIYAYILTLLPDRSLSEDILQETCIEAWQKSNEFVEGTNFLAWLCSIAHFKVMAHRRDLGREKIVFDDRLLNDIVVAAGRQLSEQTGSYSRALDDCLDELPEPQRELVLQRYGPAGSLKRMAESLGRTSASVAVSLYRVRRTLMKCIERKASSGF